MIGITKSKWNVSTAGTITQLFYFLAREVSRTGALACGGARSRTQIIGFGDRRPTIERHPLHRKHIVKNPRIQRGFLLLNFLMDRMLSASRAELFEFELALHRLLVLRHVVVQPLALTTAELCQIVREFSLSHANFIRERSERL